jgi:hypothetical protein
MSETELRIRSVEIAAALKPEASDLIIVAEAIFRFISLSSGSP